MKFGSIGMILALLIFLAIIVLGGYMLSNQKNRENKTTTINEDFVGDKIKLETNQGDILIGLYSDMSITTENFKKLTENKIYDGVIFHRVIDGFMIQGGDPMGTGYGDPSIESIQDEFTHNGGNLNIRGTIAMANSGPNTGSSQFFINLVDNSFLNDKHPVFGEVIKGMEIVDKIAKVETNENDKPLEDVVILKASLAK